VFRADERSHTRHHRFIYPAAAAVWHGLLIGEMRGCGCGCGCWPSGNGDVVTTWSGLVDRRRPLMVRRRDWYASVYPAACRRGPLLGARVIRPPFSEFRQSSAYVDAVVLYLGSDCSLLCCRSCRSLEP